MVNTTEDEIQGYKKVLEQAKLAPHFQKPKGHTSTKDFLEIVERGLIPNCPINNSTYWQLITFWASYRKHQGKTTRRKMRKK